MTQEPPKEVVLALKNFQSIAKGKLTFSPGITCITGPNGSGKSAIMRAISALVLNPPSGRRYIKQGESTAVVAMRIPGSPDVIWQRTENTSSYSVGGSGVYQKAGRTKLHQIVPDYCILADEGRVLNQQSEWDCLFPFDKSPADMFHLLEDIFSLVDSDAIFTQIKQDEQEMNRQEEALQASQDLLTMKASVVDTFLKDFNENEAKLLASTYKDLHRNSIDVSSDYQNVAALESLKGIDLYPESFDFTKVAEYGLLLKDLQQVEQLHTLDSVNLHPEAFDFTQIPVLESMLEDIAIMESLSQLDSVSLKETTFDFSQVQPLSMLIADIQELTSLQTELTAILNQLEMSRDALQRAELELKAFKVCPLCGSKLA